MKFVYKPEGADPKEWDIDPTRLMSPEVEVIERNTKMTFAEWAEGIAGGSFVALHGLLYVLLKRSHPTLRWDDVQFCMADLSFEATDEERELAYKDLVMRRNSLSPQEEAYLAELEKNREAADLETVGKA